MWSNILIVDLFVLVAVHCHDELCKWGVQEARQLTGNWTLLATRPHRVSWIPETTAEFLEDDINPASGGHVLTGKSTRDAESWDGTINKYLVSVSH